MLQEKYTLLMLLERYAFSRIGNHSNCWNSSSGNSLLLQLWYWKEGARADDFQAREIAQVLRPFSMYAVDPNSDSLSTEHCQVWPNTENANTDSFVESLVPSLFLTFSTLMGQVICSGPCIFDRISLNYIFEWPEVGLDGDPKLGSSWTAKLWHTHFCFNAKLQLCQIWTVTIIKLN